MIRYVSVNVHVLNKYYSWVITIISFLKDVITKNYTFFRRYSMELSEYLLSGHRHLYKNQTRGTCTDLKSTQRNLNIQNRRQKRDNILFNNRNIDSALSPITPATQKKTPREKQVYKMDECAERLRQLAKWKEEKEKMKKLNRKNSKPVFKVSRVTPPVGLPDLELVNKQIKGKVFTTVQKPTLPDLQTKQPKMPAKTPTKIPKSTNKTPVRKQNTVTAPKSTNKTPVQKQDTKPDSKLTKKTPLRKQNLEKSTNKTPVQKQNTELTPTQVDDRPRTPPYLSPYVTVSRGKKMQDTNTKFEQVVKNMILMLYLKICYDLQAPKRVPIILNIDLMRKLNAWNLSVKFGKKYEKVMKYRRMQMI